MHFIFKKKSDSMIHMGWEKNPPTVINKMHTISLESKEVYVLI